MNYVTKSWKAITCACFISIFALTNVNVLTHADMLPRGILLPSASSAVSDDAMATVFNPAGLGINRGMNAYYLHTFSGETGGDNAFFISSSGFGLGLEFADPGPLDYTKYTLSDGMKLFNGMYLGTSYARFKSDDALYDGLSTWDIGFLLRPADSFSLGFVARNLNRPDFGGISIDRTYDASLAIRPFTNRVTLSVDGEFRQGKKARDARFTYAMECEPIDGIILRGSYSNDDSFDITVGINSTKFGLGVYNRFDSESNHDGGAFYARFSGERYRTKLRTGRYFLELEARDIVSGRIQDSPLQRAKEDKAVKGVILKLSDSGYGIGSTQEMRDAIMEFRSSGKKVICYMELARNMDYYLAAACDEILLNPAGYLFLYGFRAEPTFYKGLLDKLGVEAQLYHVGKYKSAMEMFTREGMSRASRESLDSLMDDLSDQMVSGIAEGRPMSRSQIIEKINEGPYSAKEALDAGLVDNLVYEDQLGEVARQAFGKSVIRLSAREYGGGDEYRYDWSDKPRLAVIYAEGTIAPGRYMSGGERVQDLGLFPQIMSSETITDAISKARKDNSVKAIVLRIDSGGGSVFASDLIWREVLLAREKKPVIVSMGDAAASGGYYIACPADAIVADPGTVTGSIGVIAGKFSFGGLYDKLGIEKEIVKKGKNSDIFTLYSEFNDEQQEIVNRQMQEIYDDFVQKVAQGRNMQEVIVDSIAQGRVWTGRQAKDNGLVDELGGLRLALSMAKVAAGLEPDESVDIVTLPKRIPLWQRLIFGEVSFSSEGLYLTSLLRAVEAVEGLANDRFFFVIPYQLDFE